MTIPEKRCMLELCKRAIGLIELVMFKFVILNVDESSPLIRYLSLAIVEVSQVMF